MNELYIFFFNDTATTEIYTLSLHDALPISDYSVDHEEQLIETMLRRRPEGMIVTGGQHTMRTRTLLLQANIPVDRKSTRLNSSHANISYAVFCLKKKKYQLTQSSSTSSLHL